MTNDYSEIMSSVIHHIKKAVLGTTPSKWAGELPQWRSFSGEDFDAASKRIRMFDVLEDGDGPETLFVHQSARDYNVTVNILIYYSDDEHINPVAFSDWDKIRWSLINSDKYSLYNLGFHFFQFSEQTPNIPAPDEDDEYRVLTIPVVCRITVDAVDIAEEWEDTEDQGAPIYEDTSWSDDFYEDITV